MRTVMAGAGMALAAWGSACAQESADTPDVRGLAERYGKLTATSRPDISPDGRYLARQVAHDGRYMLRIERVDGSEAVRWAPEEGASLGAFDWTGDNELLVRTTVLAGARKRTVDPDGKQSALYVEIFEAQRPQVLTPRGMTVAKMTFKRIGDINVFTLLAAPEASRGSLPVLIGTEEGGRRGEKFGPARVSLKKNRYDFEERPVKGSGYYQYVGNHDASAVLASRTEFGETATRYYLRTGDGDWNSLDGLDLAGFELLAVEDADTLLVRGGADGGLHLFSVAENAVSETLHEGDGWPIRRPSDGKIVAVGVRDGAPVFLDADERAAHAAAEAVIGPGLYPLDASHDRRFRLYSGATGGGPVAYHVWDAQAGRVVRTLTSMPQMAKAPRPEITRVAYTARDGLKIEGFLSRPVALTAEIAADGAPLPLVVMLHGGPAARDTDGFDAWREYLTALGYAVFQPNFRGSTGYGDAFARAGYAEWGAGMQTDIADGVAALVAAGDADPDRLAIMGASYGGYAALMGTLDETPYRCAVSIAGPTDLLGMLSAEQTGAGFAYWAAHMGKGQLSDAEFAARSPLRRAREIGVPILLIRGGLDHVVRKGQSAALEKAVRKAGGDVSAVYLMRSGHGFEVEEERQRMFAEAGAFLTRCLPPA